MEREIGEIFEHKGNLYQVTEAPLDEHSCNTCQACICYDGGGECDGGLRSDGKFIIFKKLKNRQSKDERDRRLFEKVRKASEFENENSSTKCFFICQTI